MSARPLKIAVIAGEVSGDLLGGDLIAALKQKYQGEISLIGVGGEALEDQGLSPLFDFSELSVMGLSQVLAGLPKFIRLIKLTAREIIEQKPDLLLIIDSPDFTHRVAKKVRKALPDLPVIDYVCPSVWAWKEYRATAMLAYVDMVLAVLPFEPKVMQDLGGPETHFIGHRLTADIDLRNTRAARAARHLPGSGQRKTLMLLPGSRGSEIKPLMPVMGEAAAQFIARNGPTRIVLPTVPRREALVQELARSWSVQPEIVVGSDAKWQAFADADVAIAASGTVILELALAGVPVVSCYKMDWLIRFYSNRIKTWSGALPNLIADYPVVPEYLNDYLRPGNVMRAAERLSSDTLQRRAMLEGFDFVWQSLETEVSPGEQGAVLLLDLLSRKGKLA